MKKTSFNNSYIKATKGICEGENIVTRVARMIASNEPISDGAPIIHTEKKDGVLPQYDIRTDKWDYAQSAMDNISANEIAKTKAYLEAEKETETETPTETPKTK